MCCLLYVSDKYKTRLEHYNEHELPIYGRSKSLICIIEEEGHPDYGQYHWYHRSRRLRDSTKHQGTDTSVLTIFDLDYHDIGWYDCGMKNQAGESSSHLYIWDIYGK